MKRLKICAVLWVVFFAQATAAQTATKKIRVNGAELHYVEQGKGVAVIFVHGGLDDYRVWREQMAPFAEHYHTVAYSRRYNYPNPRVAPRADYSASVDADDLAALIRELKLGPAHVVGVSFGGEVALLLASRHPELVRSLVLSEAPLLPWLQELEGGKPLLTEFMTTVWEPAGSGFRVSDRAGIKAAVKGFGELGYSGTEQKMTFETLPPDAQNSALENALEWRALTMSTDAFRTLTTDDVRQISMPSLLLSGERSLKMHGLIDSKLVKLLPHAERIILSGATHEMWNEYPAECRRAALAFFAKH